MRYDDWDVILFPKDSHIPIQEFKTACYVSPDEYECQPPSLTCYISSLAPTTPFRISIHSWATAAKPSSILETQRKPNQKIVYTVQVVVDRARAFYGFFEFGSKWPQEIVHEKPFLFPSEQPTSQRKSYLQFPPFHQQTLIQSCWDARDPNGRIRIILSEQLVTRASSPGAPDLGPRHDIVCFSFQHAPKDILEQAGISWPIRNPLYLPNVHDRATRPSQRSPTRHGTSKTHPVALDVDLQSPLSPSTRSTFTRLNPEPHNRPHSHLPPISNFAKPPFGNRAWGRASIWDDSFSTVGDSGDDVSMNTWSTKPPAPNSTGDQAMFNFMCTSSHLSKPVLPWPGTMPRHEQSTSARWNDQQSRKDKERQLVVTLRDDQLGQIIEAISPPKRNKEPPNDFDSQRHGHTSRPATAHAYYPPKMGAVPTNRPSSAAPARTSSYPDFNIYSQTASNRPSPDELCPGDVFKDKIPRMYHPSISSNKENRPPSQLRFPTPYPEANRVPTPHPFAPRLSTFNSDVSMRDPSSVYSSLSRFDYSIAPPLPMALNNVKSRKEGREFNSPKSSDQGIRHDQSLLTAANGDPITPRKPSMREHDKNAHNTPKIPASVEIIDLDAIDPSLCADESQESTKLFPSKSTHTSGMSSIDSTVRLERQLYSALGDELGSFEQQIDTTGMGHELARALGGTVAHSDLSGSTMLNPSASEFEPVVKRKRRGTLGGDRDRSPQSKKEKGGLAEGGEAGEEIVPRLRGD
ncbi:Nn.00g074050.m01.CDS01 [Neocucurbitaria sp. VM-36]